MLRRWFFALWPESAARQSLSAAACVALREAVAAGARAIPAENWHITLCFLGEQPSEVLARVCAAAARVRSSPMSITLTQLEFWRDSAVLCVTPDGRSEQAAAAEQLATALNRALDAAGISHDVKRFRVHLTLARKVANLPTATVTPVTLAFDRFALIESRPGPEGSIYSVVDSWHLYSE